MSRTLYTEVAQRLAERVAVAAEGPRLARGRSLQRRGRVHDMFVSTGEIVATVQGSDPEPYEVGVSTRMARSYATGIDLVPEQIDMAFSCTCPDWGDPCKHGIAVMLQFAQDVDRNEDLLAKWRGAQPAQAEDGGAAVPGADLDRALRHLPVSKGMPGRHEDDEEADLPDPLAEFFAGAMPTSGAILDGEALASLAYDKNPFRSVRMMVEDLDGAPVFADALDVVTSTLGGG